MAPWIALAALAGLRGCYWLLAPPNPDEAYYWLWGLRPALSYYDHPPLHAWLQGTVHAVLGRSLFALRLPTLLTLAGDLWLLHRLTGRVQGRSGGARWWAVAVAFLASPLFLMFTSFAWSDHLLVFFVLLATSSLLDFLTEVALGGRGHSRSLFLGAAALGLAALCKYNAVFLAVGLATCIAGDPRLRRLWRDPRFGLAILLCAAIVAPVLVWNLAHGGASFRYHLVERHVHGGGLRLDLRGTFNFAITSVLFLSPFLLAGLWAGRQSLPATAGAHGAVYRRLALWTFASSTLLFGLLSTFSVVLYYWNLVAWLVLLPLAAALADRPRLLRAHLAYGLVLGLGMTAHAVLIPLSVPFPFIQDDDSKMLHGWPEVVAALRAEQVRLPGPAPFLATTDYRSASALAFALDDGQVVALSDRRSQFDLWLGPGAHRGQDALLVSDAWHPLTSRTTQLFDAIEPVRTVRIERLGAFVKEYWIHRAREFHGSPAEP